MKKLFLVTLAVLLVAGHSFGACTTAFPTTAKAEFLSGVHDTADTYKLAFYTDTATYGAATTAYSATNEVAGTGYSAGGFIVADNGSTKVAPTVTTSGTTGMLDFTNSTWNTITFNTASTCAILYNDTEAGDPAIAVFSFSSVQPSAGDLTADFPDSGASTSTLRISQIMEYLFGVNEAYAESDVELAMRWDYDLPNKNKEVTFPGRVDAVVTIPSVKADFGVLDLGVQ